MLLFLDESGTDHQEAPYEILAGIAICERDLWPFIQAINTAECTHFGMLLRTIDVEFKGRKLLKHKIFRFARQDDDIPLSQRAVLAHAFLEKGACERAGTQSVYNRLEFTAYGQAALAFVQEIYALCMQFNVKVFASMVEPNAPKPEKDFLRKDYAYLFERFFYFLEDISTDEMGLLIFDEVDRARCRRLLNQMESYFSQTRTGQLRSARIVPMPFFVHSDLTAAIQVADIVAYSLNWGLRLNRMARPTRPEMEPFGQLAFTLRYIGQRPIGVNSMIQTVHGITYIHDLRPHDEKGEIV